MTSGRRPVKIGAAGEEIYLYRGDVANTAIKMAGSELGLFTERKEITHKNRDLDQLSDVELVQVLAKEAQELLEYHRQEGEAE
jgi:hypothetical protein